MSDNTAASKQDPAIPPKYIIVAIATACIWLTIWAFYIFIASKDNESAWIAKLGQIGDAFGPLTAFLTASALFTAIIATFIQIREFRSQLREMQLSAEEMQNQTATYREQLAEARVQSSILREQMHSNKVAKLIMHLPYFEITIPNSINLRIWSTCESPIFQLSLSTTVDYIEWSDLHDLNMYVEKQIHGNDGLSDVQSHCRYNKTIPRLHNSSLIECRLPPKSTALIFEYTLCSGQKLKEHIELSSAEIYSNKTQQVYLLESAIRSENDEA